LFDLVFDAIDDSFAGADDGGKPDMKFSHLCVVNKADGRVGDLEKTGMFQFGEMPGCNKAPRQ